MHSIDASFDFHLFVLLCVRLFQVSNCHDPSHLITDYIRDSDSPTFDLGISLFQARATDGSSSSSSSSSSASSATSVTETLLHHWHNALRRLGRPFASVRLSLESPNMIEAQIPVREFFLDEYQKNGQEKRLHEEGDHAEQTPNGSSSSPSSASHDANSFAIHADRFCTLLTLLAEPSQVEYISQQAPFLTHNRHASPLIQQGTYHRPGLLYQNGLTGKGQVITVADTGVAHGSCWFHDPTVPTPIDRVDMSHRKIVAYMNTRGKSYDLPSGHGSHTAASIAGHVDLTSSYAEPRSADETETLRRLAEYNGVAYQAKLAVFDVNDGLTTGKIKPPKDIYGRYYELAYNTMGARISSNSWGSRNGSYISSLTRINTTECVRIIG